MFLMCFYREPQIQSHLKDVYSSMAIALLSAAIGGYVHLFTNILQVIYFQLFLSQLMFGFVLKGGLLSALCAIGFVIALYSTPDDGKNRTTRLLYLIGFAFASGFYSPISKTFDNIFC